MSGAKKPDVPWHVYEQEVLKNKDLLHNFNRLQSMHMTLIEEHWILQQQCIAIDAGQKDITPEADHEVHNQPTGDRQ